MWPDIIDSNLVFDDLIVRWIWDNPEHAHGETIQPFIITDISDIAGNFRAKREGSYQSFSYNLSSFKFRKACVSSVFFIHVDFELVNAS